MWRGGLRDISDKQLWIFTPFISHVHTFELKENYDALKGQKTFKVTGQIFESLHNLCQQRRLGLNEDFLTFFGHLFFYQQLKLKGAKDIPSGKGALREKKKIIFVWKLMRSPERGMMGTGCQSTLRSRGTVHMPSDGWCQHELTDKTHSSLSSQQVCRRPGTSLQSGGQVRSQVGVHSQGITDSLCVDLRGW